MNSLLILNFETGDTDQAYYTVMVVIHHKCNANDFYTIEDKLDSFVEQNDDFEFENIVEEVLKQSGYEWDFIKGKIPECENAYTIHI